VSNLGKQLLGFLMQGDTDETRFRGWLSEHRGILLKVAGSFTTTAEDRDDLIQEILIRLWAAMPSYQGRSKPSTWIYRVALNRAMTWQRDESRRRRRHVPLIEVVDTRESTSTDQRLLNVLYAEIRGLNKVDRSLILMSLDKCTYQEMAEVMGMSESNVGVRLSRAKKQLSDRLAGHADER
jgi:RNA polymerase sigma-70 factor (ECF subfamily)